MKKKTTATNWVIESVATTTATTTATATTTTTGATTISAVPSCYRVCAANRSDNISHYTHTHTHTHTPVPRHPSACDVDAKIPN